MKDHDQIRQTNQFLESLFGKFRFSKLTKIPKKASPKIIQKNMMEKKLTVDEKHKSNHAWKVSSLAENFGKIAITIISGYGVGADIAARILRKWLMKNICLNKSMNAERQYVVTIGFLDS